MIPRALLTLLLGALVFTFASCDSGSSVATKTPPDVRATGNQEPAKVPRSQEIKTVSDFEHSEFCQRYHCKQSGSYVSHFKDRTLTEYNYDTTVDHLTVNVTAEGPLVAMCGLTFYERERLSDGEFAVISTLSRSTNQHLQHDKTRTFVKQNVEHPICSTCRVYDSPKYVVDGQFRIRTGKSGSQQVVNFKRVGMLD
jgi:hypothetical protein